MPNEAQHCKADFNAVPTLVHSTPNSHELQDSDIRQNEQVSRSSDTYSEFPVKKKRLLNRQKKKKKTKLNVQTKLNQLASVAFTLQCRANSKAQGTSYTLAHSIP